MPKIKCASIDCIWNGKSNFCQYKGTLVLNDANYHTVNEGFQHFHKCRMYQKDDAYVEVERQLTEFMKGFNNKKSQDFVKWMEDRGLD